jgi:hypothetical protein
MNDQFRILDYSIPVGRVLDFDNYFKDFTEK